MVYFSCREGGLCSKKEVVTRVLGIVILLGFLTFWGVHAQEHREQGQHQEHEHVMGEQTIQEGKDLGICPVMGMAASEKYSYIHEGKTYHFCCPSCIEKFKKNPQKYISKIKEIKLEAYQFEFAPKRLVVKKGDIVRLLASSRDVPHGVYIGEYNINAPVKKGEIKKIEFIADKVGEFEILCSVYCGRGHHSMKATLIVEQ